VLHTGFEAHPNPSFAAAHLMCPDSSESEAKPVTPESSTHPEAWQTVSVSATSELSTDTLERYTELYQYIPESISKFDTQVSELAGPPSLYRYRREHAVYTPEDIHIDADLLQRRPSTVGPESSPYIGSALPYDAAAASTPHGNNRHSWVSNASMSVTEDIVAPGVLRVHAARPPSPVVRHTRPRLPSRGPSQFMDYADTGGNIALGVDVRPPMPRYYTPPIDPHATVVHASDGSGLQMQPQQSLRPVNRSSILSDVSTVAMPQPFEDEFDLRTEVRKPLHLWSGTYLPGPSGRLDHGVRRLQEVLSELDKDVMTSGVRSYLKHKDFLKKVTKLLRNSWT
jgi:hypothetical protein